MAKRERVLVTSALPYANGPLHIGHLAGAYLPADIYVRYQRLKGSDIVYICGSDEHGVPITLRAEQEGVKPQTIIDRYHEQNKESFRRFGISFDNYSRTSLPVHHETGQEFFADFHQKGLLKKKRDEQFYDEEARVFLPDRYVEGTCPKCDYPEARGDQCENCGSDLNQTELINPKSKISGKRPVLRETYHWHFPLGHFQDRLKTYIDSHPEWKPNVKNYCYGWIKQGLRDRAVTRDLDWGIKVPLAEAEHKVLYVWFEAVLGYISSTKEWAAEIGDPERWKKYWQDESCKLIHFIGKDNIVFHALMFPALLMAKGDYILPENVPANEFLNIEAAKISTSRNFAVWVDDYLKTFPPDPLRYCLAAIAPETKDSDFSWAGFQTRNNSELVGILGNFVNRSLTFVTKHFEGRVPERGAMDGLDERMLARIAEAPRQIGSAIEAFEMRQALRGLMNLCRHANKYFNDKQPWRTLKEDRITCATTLSICIEVSNALSVLMEPFLPFSATRLHTFLGKEGEVNQQRWSDVGRTTLAVGHRLSTPEILFDKIEDSTIQAEMRKLAGESPHTEAPTKVKEDSNLITIDDFKRIDMRVAQVLTAERVEKTDKLLRLEVQLGDEKRQIIAGMAQHLAPETLPGKKVVIVANLKPAKIRGFESQGMLLAAEDDAGNLSLLTLDGEIDTGAQVK